MSLIIIITQKNQFCERETQKGKKTKERDHFTSFWWLFEQL